MRSVATALGTAGRAGRAAVLARSLSTPAPGAADALRTSFGYDAVDERDKAARVASVFSSVAPSYDVMNDIMSAGMHRLWKDHLVSTLGAPVAGTHHLDVAGGTGDVGFRVLARLRAADAEAADAAAAARAPPPPLSSVTVCDINPDMLAEGRRKAEAEGIAGPDLAFVEGDAEALPFDDASFDAYTIAFGIRNVTRVDAALRTAARVLKRGGHFACLEFSPHPAPVLAPAYDAYSFTVIPAVGQAVAGDADAYRYLVESIRRFPPRAEFAAMLRAAGLSGVRYESLAGGVVSIHHGFKL